VAQLLKYRNVGPREVADAPIVIVDLPADW
jgi:hypothetical protein